MKLYIVTYFDYGYSSNEHALPLLYGVFDTLEKAENYCKEKFNRSRWQFPPDYEIEEILINQDLS